MTKIGYHYKNVILIIFTYEITENKAMEERKVGVKVYVKLEYSIYF